MVYPVNLKKEVPWRKGVSVRLTHEYIMRGGYIQVQNVMHIRGVLSKWCLIIVTAKEHGENDEEKG